MNSLFLDRTFAGFGPTRLLPQGPPSLERVRGGRPAVLRHRVRERVPRLPGVYGMLDGRGRLIYVGKAKCLRSRLLTYFRPKSRDPKAGKILREARTIVWEVAPSEFAALLRELELIRRWQPRWNVQGQPKRRRRTYVCVGRRPAPYLFVAPRPTSTALACYGPVPAGQVAREAVRRLNDWYGLRDCPQSQQMHFADQGELFPVLHAAGCLRYELGTCIGPCVGACTRAAYYERVRAAQAFLVGADPAPIEAAERLMLEAAAAQQYERAASLRDRTEALRWLRDHLARLHQARERCCCVYPVATAGGGALWYLLHRARVVAVVPAPVDAATRQAATTAVTAVLRLDAAAADATREDAVDAVLLVASWFRRHAGERERCLTYPQALEACAAAD